MVNAVRENLPLCLELSYLATKKTRSLTHAPHLLDCRESRRRGFQHGTSVRVWLASWIMVGRGAGRVDLISDRVDSLGRRVVLSKTEANEPIATTTAATAPPDNIPFWKSDFSAVLAIFAASFPPSFFLRLLSFHPSLPPSSRGYVRVRSISSRALRSNPSDPTYSKAALSVCLLRHYSDSIPAENKLNRLARLHEPNFCRIIRNSESMDVP